MEASTRSACRSDPRLMPRSSHRTRSAGSREPGGSFPESISDRSRSTVALQTCSVSTAPILSAPETVGGGCHDHRHGHPGGVGAGLGRLAGGATAGRGAGRLPRRRGPARPPRPLPAAVAVDGRHAGADGGRAGNVVEDVWWAFRGACGPHGGMGGGRDGVLDELRRRLPARRGPGAVLGDGDRRRPRVGGGGDRLGCAGRARLGRGGLGRRGVRPDRHGARTPAPWPGPRGDAPAGRRGRDGVERPAGLDGRARAVQRARLARGVRRRPRSRTGRIGMTAQFKDLALDATDHQALAGWWCRAMGFVRRDSLFGDTRPDDWPGPIVDPDGNGPLIWINPGAEKKTVKNRMHLDVFGDKTELLELGATLLRERGGDVEWEVLAAPEGNEFCIFTPR